MAGQYKSVFRGVGIEFDQVREYNPGDDVKTLDWKVSARFGKPFVKQYKEERESIVMLMIDMSASLQFGTFSGPKLERAAEVASVLAFNAIKNNDKVGVVFFTDQVEKYIPPKKGTSHIWRVIKEIFTFKPQGLNTNISNALDSLSRISKKRSLVFILSDFLDDGYLKSLRTLRQKHEIIGVNIYDKGSFSLPDKGILLLRDLETSRQIVLDGFNRKIHSKYNSIRKKDYIATAEIFKKAKSDLIALETSSSVSETLLKYFRFRERRLR